MYDFFRTLRRHRRRWQTRGHYLRRVCHDLLGAQYLSAYHTTVVRHHTHAHWIVTVRVTHVRAQCHLAHHGCHWAHGTHTHHGITHPHPPNTGGRFHLRAYAWRVACIRRRQDFVVIRIVHVVAIILRGVSIISLLDSSIIPPIPVIPLLPPVPVSVASVAAFSPRSFVRQCTSYNSIRRCILQKLLVLVSYLSYIDIKTNRNEASPPIVVSRLATVPVLPIPSTVILVASPVTVVIRCLPHHRRLILIRTELQGRVVHARQWYGRWWQRWETLTR